MPGRDLRRPVSNLILGAEGALWASAFFCPLALGGSPAWTLWPLCVLSGLAAVTAAMGSRRRGHSLALPAFTAALVFGVVLCLFQLVPWPRPVLDWLSPASAQLRDFALIPLGLPAARPISLDPPATWRGLAKGISYLLLFFATVQVVRSHPRGRRRLAAAIALSGLLVALVGYVHALADAHSLFGIHSYAVAPPFLTTFGNPNHLSCLLTLTSTVSLGLALSTKEKQRAALWALSYVASGTAVFFSLSRGGICFFIAAQLLFAFLLFRRRQQRSAAPPASRPLPGRESWVILGIFMVLSISAFVASERILAELQTADSVQKLRDSKMQMWPMLTAGAAHFSRSGMGRGAFEAAFSRYQTGWPEVTLTHPENIVLQLWAELGLLGAALVGLTATWAYLRLLRENPASSLQLALLSGLAGMALHDFFDFGLELPGCAVAACIAIGLASGSDNILRAEAGRLTRRWSASWAAALSGLALIALVKGRSVLPHAEQELTARLSRLTAPNAVASAVLPAIDLHPADYLLYDLAGRAFSRTSPHNALAFANRALFLRPLDVESHRIAARALLRLGRPSQGLLEYRLAYETGQDQAATLNEAVPAARDLEEVKLVIPRAPVPVSDVAARLDWSSRRALAEALLADALTDLAAHPDAPELWLLDARYRADQRDFAGALDAVAKAEKSWPSSPRPVMVKAAILSQEGQRAEAISLLEAFFARHPDSLELSFALAQMHIEAGGGRRARQVLARASPLVPSPLWRSRWLWMEGESFEGEGQYARALQSYQAAARVLPTEPENHYSVARALQALDRPAEAMDAVREGMKYESPAGVERCKARLAELENSRRRLEAQRDEKMLAR